MMPQQSTLPFDWHIKTVSVGYQVTSMDVATNSASSTEASFTTPAMTLTDTSVADFNAALDNTCYISDRDDGEVILIPAIGSEFDGSTLPAGWTS